MWFLQGGIGYPNTGVFTIIQNNHKTITAARPFRVVLSIVNAAFSIQLIDGEDCNISSLEGFPIPVAHLLHLCGSWKEGQSRSHPSLLWILVLSNVQRTLINFSCLSSFILWDRLSSYSPVPRNCLPWTTFWFMIWEFLERCIEDKKAHWPCGDFEGNVCLQWGHLAPPSKSMGCYGT